MITYIQLGSKGILDVKDEVSVPLNFSIAEIQDISKKQGSFSKSIQLVGTANNNNLLSNLFDVNIADATFNINAKEPCQIIQNGTPIFDGFLQLLSVNKISPSSDVNEFVEYTVQINAGTGTFYASMQEDLLEDLPLWEQYNHIYTLSAITATSAHTVTDGYTYFLPLKSTTAYEITDFAPAIYAKAYWDRIFLVNNFTYDWDSLESVGFDKLIIPYNGDTPIKNNEVFNFRAGFSSGSTQEQVIMSASTVLPGFGFSTLTQELDFDDDSTSPNFDNNDNYDTTNNTYTVGIINENEFRIRYKYTVELIAPVNATLTPVPVSAGLSPETATFSLGLGNILRIDGTTDLEQTFLGPILYESSPGGNINLPAGTTTIVDSVCDTNIIFSSLVGQEVKPYISYGYSYSGVWLLSGTTTPLTQAEIPYFRITRTIDPTDYDNNSFTVNLTGSLNEGQEVEMSRFIPKQIKQKDFISSIIKMYNLYIVPDKYEDNHLIIKTRDEFYDDGDIVDWTHKLSTERDSLLEFLPDLQDKRLILSYKDDNDEWNKNYKEDTKETYGQVQYTFDTEFTQSTKRIETIFSPTPIVNNSNGLLVPAILNKNPKNNIRILQYNGWVDGRWFYTAPLTTETSFLTLLTTYPQALHLDNPINPTIDINYAEPDYYFYTNYETVTNNNLYNKYWSRFINQIETGKMLTATFLLNENDIANLDLAAKIWVHDNYYNINRIIDYNPNGNGLTKVELITVDEGLQFGPTSFDKNDSASGVVNVGPKNNWISNLESIKASNSQNSFGTSVFNTQVLGGGNTVQGGSNSSIVIGDGNNYQGRYGFVAGEDNTVQGDNLYVFGGSGLTVTGSSQAVFNVPVSATTISATTIFIDGSDTPIEPAVWGEGTGGVSGFAIKAINDTTTDATGDYAVAEGLNTLASGGGSHAEGSSTTSSGPASHAEGILTVASGDFSHAEGNSTTALGNTSHAEGGSSVAIGSFSHAAGSFTSARFDGEVTANGIISGIAGETQCGYINRVGFTTDATPTNIDFLTAAATQNGFAPPLAVTSVIDIAMSFRYQFACFNSATGAARIITGEGMIKWISGTPTLVFASTPSNNGDAGLAGITAVPVANGLGLKFTITGLAATNISWNLRMDYNW